MCIFKELGIFISVLMSRTLRSTITNMFSDEPLVCGNQLYLQGFRRNVSSFQPDLRRPSCHKVEDLKLGLLVRILVLNLDDLMDEDPQSEYESLYLILRIHICLRIRISTFGVHILEVVMVHWLDDECHSQRAWMSFLKHVMVQGVAHVAADGWFDWETPMGFLIQVKSAIYELQNHFNPSTWNKIKHLFISLKQLNYVMWQLHC